MNAFFFWALLALFAFQTFFLIRNDWVYRQREIVLEYYGDVFYERLPSYQVMFWTFWIWDIDTFVYGDKKQ